MAAAPKLARRVGATPGFSSLENFGRCSALNCEEEHPSILARSVRLFFLPWTRADTTARNEGSANYDVQRIHAADPPIGNGGTRVPSRSSCHDGCHQTRRCKERAGKRAISRQESQRVPGCTVVPRKGSWMPGAIGLRLRFDIVSNKIAAMLVATYPENNLRTSR
jgi:hypothetical protein